MARKSGRMGSKGKKTFDRTNLELADEELRVLQNTKIDWESLRPKISNMELYDKLIDEIKLSTKRNENLSQFRYRIQELGKEGVDLSRKIIKMIF